MTNAAHQVDNLQDYLATLTEAERSKVTPQTLDMLQRAFERARGPYVPKFKKGDRVTTPSDRRYKGEIQEVQPQCDRDGFAVAADYLIDFGQGPESWPEEWLELVK